MIGFIDDHRVVRGVSAICRLLPIAPSTYYACLAVRADPSKASARHQRDAVLRPKIQKIWDDNWKVYAARKAWRQLCREGEAVARCTVARLMAGMGLRGIVRGKAMKPTIHAASVPCPRDKVNRKFRVPAPNMLWGRSLWRHWFEPNGRRFHLRADMVRDGLRRPSPWSLGPVAFPWLDHRRVRKADRGLAHLDIHEDTVCPRCAGAGNLGKKNAG